MKWLRRYAVVLTVSATSACGLATRDPTIVRASWRAFLSSFVQPDGRIVRPEHGNDTVSEAQAYGMLRAAWMNDQATFDRIWRWSETHLSRTRRGEDHLLAWHWEPHGPSSGEVVDWNPASDADQDYALALLLAASRWQQPAARGLPRYDDHARAVLSDLLAHATARDQDGTLLLLPGPWADERETTGDLILNPSYFSPGWYRVFYQFTGDNRWNELADSSYLVLETACGLTSDAIRAGTGLDSLAFCACLEPARRGPCAVELGCGPRAMAGWDRPAVVQAPQGNRLREPMPGTASRQAAICSWRNGR